MELYGRTARRMICLILVGITFCVIANAQQTSPTFTLEQADIGESTYQETCARCHGASLHGASLAPALVGQSFTQRWASQPIAGLFSFMKKTMPPENAGALSDSAYSAIIAYILEAYGLPATMTPLPSEVGALNSVLMPSREILQTNQQSWGSGIAPGVVLPPWPAKESPLERMTKVDGALLASPPAGSWLSWRRTHDAAGFSPLQQITKNNVRQMQVAWTLALPPGPNEATPLVHDGVMYIHSFGDHIQALDAATGDELWHYRPESPVVPIRKKNIALYDDRVYFTTSDSRVMALDSKTGKLTWSWSVHDSKLKYLSGGGPTIANGVVVQGGLSALGAGSVIGLDAATGKLLWQFHTVARPEDPNGDSWNDLPIEQRSGGAVWTAASYDAKRGVVLFGPAPTYNTLPLRNLVNKPGVTNSALYTNSTIALEPKSGALVWFYQHLPNDQWDLDWAFERQVINLNIDGAARRTVLTAGKQAVYDALDADTGQYLFSIDLGLQNLITKIDSRSGEKSVNRDLMPGVEGTVTVCPHALGAKSWLPASYDQDRHMLYVPLVEACMDMIRVKRRGVLGGIKWALRPRPETDGKYGRLQAIDLETRKTVWIERQRAPQTSGVLATAGGVVFAGALDRWFTAYNADTGESLWRIRLSDVPNSSPISYSVDGKQYVAIVVGHGGSQSVAYLPLVPEIHLPAAHSSAVWVFKVPDRAK